MTAGSFLPGREMAYASRRGALDYCYFGWIKAAFFETWASNPETAPAAISWTSSAVLTALALATVILDFYQEPLTLWLMP